MALTVSSGFLSELARRRAQQDALRAASQQAGSMATGALGQADQSMERQARLRLAQQADQRQADTNTQTLRLNDAQEKRAETELGLRLKQDKRASALAQQRAAAAAAEAERQAHADRVREEGADLQGRQRELENEVRARAGASYSGKGVFADDEDAAETAAKYGLSPEEARAVDVRVQQELQDRTLGADFKKAQTAKAARVPTGPKVGGADDKMEDRLRREFDAQPATKKFRAAANVVQQMEQAAAQRTGAGDIALVTAFMKALDPDSVVRESEFAKAAQAGGLVDQIQSRASKVINGEELTDAQRAAFISAARSALAAQRTAYEGEFARFKEIAQRRGLDTANVVGSGSGVQRTDDVPDFASIEGAF